MAPTDLLRPLEGQREETLRIVGSLSPEDLDRTDRESGWTVRQLFGHLVAAELGMAFVIRRALDGDVMHPSPEDRDAFNQASAEDVAAWDVERIRQELIRARTTLREVFSTMAEEDLDQPVRWPDWPARTIRTSIPYMLEHEDAHLDQVQAALERD